MLWPFREEIIQRLQNAVYFLYMIREESAGETFKTRCEDYN